MTLAALLHRLIRHAVKELREVPERRKNEGRERWRAGPKNRDRRPSWDNASGDDPEPPALPEQPTMPEAS